MRSFARFLLFIVGFCMATPAPPAVADVMASAGAILPAGGLRRLSLSSAPLLHTPVPPLSVPAVDPGVSCRLAVVQAGRGAGIPDHLMSAIAHVESGRRSPDGHFNPWPWSINVEGVDHVFDTREQAIAAVRTYQASGIHSIDVGCMQVNLLHHPHAFATLEQAFSPLANARYAAQFLQQLFAQTGSWTKATAAYHSMTPELGEPYQRKVASVMGEETGRDNRLAGSATRLAMGTNPLTPMLTMPGAGVRMLSNRSESARRLPMITPGGGRSLAAYRSAPVRMAGQR